MRIEPRELAELSLPPPQRFAVPANTLVVADTCGFHGRCPSSKSARRVEIWAYSRRNPFLPWTGLDMFSLPGLASRRIGALWLEIGSSEWREWVCYYVWILVGCEYIKKQTTSKKRE